MPLGALADIFTHETEAEKAKLAAQIAQAQAEQQRQTMMYGATQVDPQGQTAMFNNTGQLAGQLANQDNMPSWINRSMIGQGGMVSPEAVANAEQVNANVNHGTYPATAQAGTNLAARTVAQNPADANPYVAKNAVWQAAFGDPMAQRAAYQQSANIPLAGGSARMIHQNPDGTTSVMPNPTTSLQNQLLGNVGGSMLGGGDVLSKYGFRSASPFNTPNLPSDNAPVSEPDNRTSNHTLGTISGQTAKPTYQLANMPQYQYDEDGNKFYNDSGKLVPVNVEKNSPIDAEVNKELYLRNKIKEGHNLKGLTADSYAKQIGRGIGQGMPTINNIANAGRWWDTHTRIPAQNAISDLYQGLTQ